MKGIDRIKGIKNIRESFKTKQVKYGGFAALITLAVIAGLILLNLIAGTLSLQLDLTSNKLYSLSEQSIQVIDSIKKPVKFYGLWRPGEESRDIMNVINLYLAKSSFISMEIKDPDRNPGFIINYDRENKGITRGSLLVEGEKGFRLISPYDMYDLTMSQSGNLAVNGISVERRITSALIYTATGTTPVVYEISGHNETPLSSLGFQNLLELENYSLKTLNLPVALIPPDASALILNNPQRDINPSEVDKLLAYLAKGGRLLILADYNIGSLANLNEVLQSYGLAFEYGIVIESNPNFYAQDQMLEIPDLLDHEICAPLADKNKFAVLMPTAMPLSMLETKRRSVDIKPLMVSSSASILRTDLNNYTAARLASDIPGPLILGAAVMDPPYVQEIEAQTRIVVLGCGGLLPIAAQGFDANRDLFMNSFAWLENRSETISIRSKSLLVMPLQITLVQVIIFGLLFVLVFPMAFFVTGFITWLKRRHL